MALRIERRPRPNPDLRPFRSRILHFHVQPAHRAVPVKLPVVVKLATPRIDVDSNNDSGYDPDPHVPFERVRETEVVLTRMGAVVELRRYPGMPHTINEDELEACRNLLQRVVSRRPEGRS